MAKLWARKLTASSTMYTVALSSSKINSPKIRHITGRNCCSSITLGHQTSLSVSEINKYQTGVLSVLSQFIRIADMSNRRRLQSGSSNQLNVPSFRLPTVGNRTFPIAGTKVWNSLPDDITSALSLSMFRRHLKTYLFRCCYNSD